MNEEEEMIVEVKYETKHDEYLLDLFGIDHVVVMYFLENLLCL